jgi:hypothetical protein
MRQSIWTLVAFAFACAAQLARGAELIPEGWDYAVPMQKVAQRFHGRPGVVIHVGDSITYSNPYGQWARFGEGKTAADQAVLKWMHLGADDDTDGWWLCRFDHPAGGRSHTACSGIRLDELLAGGKQQMPPLAEMLKSYQPQMVVLMAGTNDASAQRKVEDYRRDAEQAVDAILEQGTICILSTIPPHPGQRKLADSYNQALRDIARKRGLPLIDFEQEILRRRPDDWNGTLLGKNDVHPTAEQGGVKASSAPTDANLKQSGYLLRGWLSVQKIAEVKRKVIDAAPAKEAPAEAKPPARTSSASKEALRAPVIRDTWFSNVGDEARCNLGGAAQLKLKSIQELTLVDLDPKPLQGRVVKSATLHLRVKGPEILRRVTVSSFASPWVEGTSPRYAEQAGSSTFAAQRHPDVPWAQPGSNLTAVMLGLGGTVWRKADPTAPDKDGWQHIPVDPVVIAARVAGVSEGFIVFDDTGTEWTRDGEKYTERLFPNRYVHSRESGPNNAPYFTLDLSERDTAPPAAPGGLEANCDGLPAGEATFSWTVPVDHGPAGIAGFFVTINGKPLPQWMIPAAAKAGERVELHLRDGSYRAGEKLRAAVSAVDGAGNRGPAAELDFVASSETLPPLAEASLPEWRGGGAMPKIGKAEIAILDALDKVHPVTGSLIPSQDDGYLATNHLWSAAERRIRLHGAKNEFVTFQILVHGAISNLQPALTFDTKGKGAPEVQLLRCRYVPTKDGPLPDPLVSLRGGFSIPAADDKIAGQTRGALICEVYVPHEAKAGTLAGKLTLQAGADRLELPVSLEVWDFTLPDSLSFLPEMNCYELPANERDYYRLAHRHRTVLNRVPYYQNGRVADGCAPKWSNGTLDWAAWDKRFGGYLDGSAFADLPRRGVPIECFYLPLEESWPLPIDSYYTGDYWADRAFRPGYREAFVSASRQIAEHLHQHKWGDTLFHFFLNGKANFKHNGWSRGSSPWLLDEPANFQDYWALRYFGEAFHEGVRQTNGPAKLLFRCDISRPEWQRNALDHVLDYNVVSGGAFQQYRRLVLDRRAKFGQIVVSYGGSNDLPQSNVQPAAWCVDAWLNGVDGVLPWQTIGSDASWKQGDALALFYPGEPGGEKEPVPSIRLKAYTRGQQDVEYLTLLSQVAGEPRRATAERVGTVFSIAGAREGTGFVGGEDAGRIDYGKLRPQDLWKLRVRLAALISAKHPKAERKLVDFRTPPRDPSAGVPGYVSGQEVATAPPQVAATPRSSPQQIGFTIQGRPKTHDALIAPDQSDKNFGGVDRDNRLARTERTNAMLIRFDLASQMVLRDAKVSKATLHFWVWDPSAHGRTKVGIYGVKTPWEEGSATWKHPAAGKNWLGGADGFTVGRDTGPEVAHVIVEPDNGSDTADPPIEYQLDATALVKDWIANPKQNLGAAIAPVIDRSIDDGQFTRFQVLGSEYREPKYTPKLVVEFGQ